MGTRFFIMFLVITLCSTSYARENRCLNCHEEHYPEYGICTSCHRGIDKTSREDIAHHMLIEGKYSYFRIKEDTRVKEGGKIIDDGGCRRCHTIGNTGSLLASNLDISVNEKEINELILNLTEPTAYMPNYYFTDTQKIAVVNTLLNRGFGFDFRSGDDYTLVHLNEKTSGNLFSDKCGGCHMMLSKNYGGLGRYNIGPNLSGLFSDFFPHINDVKRWTTENIKQWLKNPRDIKKNTLMPKVELNEEELDNIIRILQ